MYVGEPPIHFTLLRRQKWFVQVSRFCKKVYLFAWRRNIQINSVCGEGGISDFYYLSNSIVLNFIYIELRKYVWIAC